MKKLPFVLSLALILGFTTFVSAQVTIYEGRDFSGKSATFGAGTYRADFGPIKTIGNDTASSIVIENGYRVKICQHEGSNNQGAGNCEEYGPGRYNLKYDNQASWVKVWGGGDSGNDSSGDGSVDLGKVIMDKIRNRNKKPKENSGGNNNQGSNSSSNGCVFKERFTIPNGQNGYVKDYPISLGNGTYRIEFTENLPRNKMHAGFGIGFFNSKKDPTGEHWTKYIEGGTNGPAESSDFWTWGPPEGRHSFGEFVSSKNFSNNKYTTLRISYWQGVAVGAGATGTYEIRIIGDGCNANSSSDNGSTSNNSNNNPPPQNEVPYDPNNQVSVKLYLIELGKGKLGCGDKLTMVPTSITKRPGMLRATLEELFRYPEIQRGYTNTTAGMTLEDVKITNGVASIYVRGSLGGECDNPRFISQITSTAKQYPTVKSVKIFLNGSEFTGSMK